MKFLKYLIFFILVLVLLFFVVGIFKKSVSYGHAITVDKPIEEAWAVSQDETKYVKWLDGFKSMELISGEKGEVGSKYKIIVNPGEGQDEVEMIETLNSIKENDHVTMHFDSDFMDFDQTMTFTEKNGKTTISTDSKVLGKGITTRAVFALLETLGGAFTKQEKLNMENLKILINENSTDYFPVQTPVLEEAAAPE